MNFSFVTSVEPRATREHSLPIQIAVCLCQELRTANRLAEAFGIGIDDEVMKKTKETGAALAIMLAEATLVALVKSAKLQKMSKEAAKKKAQSLFTLLTAQNKEYGGVQAGVHPTLLAEGSNLVTG